MWESIGVVILLVSLAISLLALGVSVFAIAVSVVFYLKSARQLNDYARRLQHTMNVLGRYLKATIKDADVDLNTNKEGDIVGLNITVRLEGVQAKATVGEVVLDIKGDKKTD